VAQPPIVLWGLGIRLRPPPRAPLQGYAWFFLGYEATIHLMLQQHAPGATKADLSFLEVMGAGVFAGFGLWGSMFPIDTIKSKIQADSLSNPQFKGEQQLPGGMHAWQRPWHPACPPPPRKRGKCA
jgi:hypothetical protein